MPARETSSARHKEQMATRRRLNRENRRQNEEVKKKLDTLRKALEHEANITRDPDTAVRLRELVHQVVARLDRLEGEDDARQAIEGSIVDFDAEAFASGTPAPRRFWRPGEPA